MPGYLSLVLHAHLPFVRHPEHEKFLEESWLFEGITETYLPLDSGFQRLAARRPPRPAYHLALATLCSMLRDPLLCERYARHLDSLIELAEKEIHRTHWTAPIATWPGCITTNSSGRAKSGGNTKATWSRRSACCKTRHAGDITTAATHGLLPLLKQPRALPARQILTARDHYRGVSVATPWASGCLNAPIRWGLRISCRKPISGGSFSIRTASCTPRHARAMALSPPFTPPTGWPPSDGIFDSSRQVWSKHEGYPGDWRYRDFYRDIGFDLDFDYVRPHLPSPENRGFTGIKYYRITGAGEKQIYQRDHALATASEHARHFLDERVAQVRKLEGILDRPPIIVAPYDAELFGHWWYEGRSSRFPGAQNLPRAIGRSLPAHARQLPAAASHESNRHARRLFLGRGRLLRSG